MKGIALIGMLITMLIVVYLTVSNLKSNTKSPALKGALEGAGADSLPATITQLPGQVQSRLNEAMERGEARRKEAEEALGK